MKSTCLHTSGAVVVEWVYNVHSKPKDLLLLSLKEVPWKGLKAIRLLVIIVTACSQITNLLSKIALTRLNTFGMYNKTF